MKRVFLITITILFITSCGILPNNETANLHDTKWRLTSYAGKTPLSGKDMTAIFESNEIQGSASCNHYFGSYRLSGENITIEGLGWTEMACMDPEGIMEQEQTLMNLLALATDFSIDGNQLRINTSEGETLFFERLPE